MKLIYQLLFVVIAATTTPALAAPPVLNTITQPVQTRQLVSFKGVAVSGSLKINIKMGNTENIRLEGNAEAIAELITEVKSGILIIRPKTKWMDWNRKFNDADVTVYINAKTLTSLTMSGSGSIDVQNTLNSGEFSATLSGSGSIKLNANVNAFTAVISGSGDMLLSGKTNDADVMINGSGSFKGESFKAETVSTKISGSGSVYITANKNINVLTVGSGTVYYKGNPVVKKKAIGSGDVKPL